MQLLAPAAFLTLVVVYPAGLLMWRSVHGASGLSAEHWRAALGSPLLGRAALNTAVVCAASSAAAVAAGAAAAWLCARTALRARPLLRLAAWSPFFVSQTVMAAAWLLVAGERALSLGGVVFVTAVVLLPVPFALLEPAAARLPLELDEAALVCGATPRQAFLRVSLPLLRPALAAALLLCAMMTAVMFSVQGALGLPANVWTLSALVYRELGAYGSDPAAAAALSCLLLGAGLVMLAAQSALVGAGGYEVVSGRHAAARRAPPPGWAGPFCLALGAVAALPYAALLRRALTPERLQFAGRASGWDLGAFAQTLARPELRRAILHSVALGVVASAATTAVALALATRALRRSGPADAAAQAVAAAPLAFSGIVLAVAFLYAFTGRPFRLEGTLLLLLLAYCAREAALAFKSAQAALAQLEPELEAQARVCGAGPWRTLAAVIWPLARRPLLAAAALVFVAVFREIEISTLLAGPGNEVFGYAVFGAVQRGELREASALGLFGAALCAAAVSLTRLWARSGEYGA